jgi:hypothetical protein
MKLFKAPATSGFSGMMITGLSGIGDMTSSELSLEVTSS